MKDIQEVIEKKISTIWLGYWIIASLLLIGSTTTLKKLGTYNPNTAIPAIILSMVPAIVVFILYLTKVIRSVKHAQICCFFGTIVTYFCILFITQMGVSLLYYAIPMLFGSICIKKKIVYISNYLTFGISAIYMIIECINNAEIRDSFTGLIIAEALFMLGSNFITQCTADLQKIHLSQVQELANSLQKQKAEIESTIEIISDDISTLNISIENSKNQNKSISQSLADMSGVIEDISESIDNQNHATNNLEQQIKTVHTSTEVINKTTDNFKLLTQSNIDKLAMAKEITDNATHSVSLVSDSINVLKDKASQVSNSLDGIDDITHKTNILALNAAIEAARAGIAGKGFTVVAEEIQKLVVQTTEVTDHIKEIIRDFNDSFTAMQQSSQEVMNTIQKQSLVVDQVTQEISSTFSKFDVVLDTIPKLEGAVTLSLDSVKEISSSIDSISATCEEVSATSEEVASSSGFVTTEMASIRTSSQTIEDRLHALIKM